MKITRKQNVFLPNLLEIKREHVHHVRADNVLPPSMTLLTGASSALERRRFDTVQKRRSSSTDAFVGYEKFVFLPSTVSHYRWLCEARILHYYLE